MGICESQKESEKKSYELKSNKINLEPLKNYQPFEKCLCKIKFNKERSLGFFCKIPFPDKYNLLLVLITKKEIIEKINISKDNKKILINNKEYDISFDDSRKIYISEKYGIAIIEIKKCDSLEDIKFYLEIDNSLYEDNINEFLDKVKVYLFYSNKNKFKSSNGEIINFKDNCFKHSCSCEEGIPFGPIITSLNHKLIGINIETSEKKIYSKGILIKELIKDFNKKYKNDIKNVDEINNDDISSTCLSEKESIENDKTKLKKNYSNKKDNENFNVSIYYLQALFLSFCLIDKLKIIFKNYLKIKKDSITFLLIKYMNYYVEDYSKCINIINEVEKKINEIDKNILQNINFEKLIDFILTKLHEELNKKKI